MKHSTIFFMLIAILNSCDWSGNYYFSIENKSSYPITIGLYPADKNQYNKTADSILMVYPNQKTVFWKEQGRNSGDRGIYFLRLFDTIYVQINDTSNRLTKDITLRENWDLKVHKYGFEGKNADYYYNFTFSDSNIQKKKE